MIDKRSTKEELETPDQAFAALRRLSIQCHAKRRRLRAIARDQRARASVRRFGPRRRGVWYRVNEYERFIRLIELMARKIHPDAILMSPLGESLASGTAEAIREAYEAAMEVLPRTMRFRLRRAYRRLCRRTGVVPPRRRKPARRPQLRANHRHPAPSILEPEVR
jgi:hypothetical protein